MTGLEVKCNFFEHCFPYMNKVLQRDAKNRIWGLNVYLTINVRVQCDAMRWEQFEN